MYKKIKFFINGFLQIWSQLLKKLFVKNFNFCAVATAMSYSNNSWSNSFKK